jgi:SWI/SNF-related matrix-associated actin-dependent regulator of chromatin subfamily A-like protein 1
MEQIHDEKQGQHRELREHREQEEAGGIDLRLLPEHFLGKLHPFQVRGVLFALQREGRALIADEMGLGKTVQAIALASCYRGEWPLLVICPSSVRHQWVNELERWVQQPGITRALDVQVVGSGREVLRGGQRIVIISYDLLVAQAERLAQRGFGVVICDESHYLKSADAQRTKAALPLLRQIPRALLLTGTPALSRPMELYPQLVALGAPVLRSRKRYGLRYCDAFSSPYGWDYSGSANLRELHLVLENTVMVRRMKADVLRDLPQKRRHRVLIRVDPEYSDEVGVCL